MENELTAEQHVIAADLQQGFELPPVIMELLVRGGIAPSPGLAVALFVTAIGMCRAAGMPRDMLEDFFKEISGMCHEMWSKVDPEIRAKAVAQAKEQADRLGPFLKQNKVKH